MSKNYLNLRLLRPAGEKLTYKQLTTRAEMYRLLASALYTSTQYKRGDEFHRKAEKKFALLAVRYQERADRFLIALPPMSPRILL